MGRLLAPKLPPPHFYTLVCNIELGLGEKTLVMIETVEHGPGLACHLNVSESPSNRDNLKGEELRDCYR